MVKWYKHTIVLILIKAWVAFCNPCFSQIFISNPSFENNETWFEKINGWDTCSNYYPAAALPTPYNPDFSPPQPPDGMLYSDIVTDGYVPSKFTFITNKLSCPLIKGSKCSLNLWAMGYFPHTGTPISAALGYFTIHLGHTSCDSAQRIYTSVIMPDTLYWRNYEFDFVPDDNYEYIGIQAHHPSVGKVTDILIDNFSPITVEVPNVAQIRIDGIDKHSCYNLQAQLPNNINATRYEWKQDGNTISNQSTVSNICVSSSSQIVFIAYDACGYGYVDTLVLQQGGINANISNNGKTLHLQMNDATENTTFALFNSLGQLLQTQIIYPNTTAFDIDIAALPSGVYFSTLQTNYGWLVKKFIKE